MSNNDLKDTRILFIEDKITNYKQAKSSLIDDIACVLKDKSISFKDKKDFFLYLNADYSNKEGWIYHYPKTLFDNSIFANTNIIKWVEDLTNEYAERYRDVFFDSEYLYTLEENFSEWLLEQSLVTSEDVEEESEKYEEVFDKYYNVLEEILVSHWMDENLCGYTYDW